MKLVRQFCGVFHISTIYVVTYVYVINSDFFNLLVVIGPLQYMLFNPPTSVAVSWPPLNGWPSSSLGFALDTIVGWRFRENANLECKTCLN